MNRYNLEITKAIQESYTLNVFNAIAKADISIKQQEEYNRFLAEEDKLRHILLPYEDIKGAYDSVLVITTWNQIQMYGDGIEVRELTVEEKINALQKLHDYFPHTSLVGLCSTITKMLKGKKLNINESLFLRKVIRHELQNRLLTVSSVGSDVWLFDRNEKSPRCEFLRKIINVYKGGRDFLKIKRS